jgi:hypothetical protein
VRHGAFAIVLQRPLKALDRFIVVEPEQPVQAAVEPELGVRRRRGDLAAVWPEIEIGHAVSSPGSCGFIYRAGQADYHKLSQA